MKRQWSYWVLTLAVFAPGCGGPDVAAHCVEQESCFHGNDADIDACEASFHGVRDNAHDIGCGEEYDLLLECLTPQYECTAIGPCPTSDDCMGSVCVEGECKIFAVDSSNGDGCEEEWNAYSRCE
jgi:hypothetical protein